ncbi:MAG: hypothetical protein RLZZ488_684 [Pseudomonadota bacterium]
MWRARVADVMNPMGSLLGRPFRNAADSYFHSSKRDALFLAAWQRAIDPSCSVILNFNGQAVLQQGLQTIVQLAEALLENTTYQASDAKIGSLTNFSSGQLPDPHPAQKETAELRLREEVLYFFGTLAGLARNSGTAEKVRSFEYLATVVGQKDELLPMIVGEHLGEAMRKNFEFLCSLHYFSSNSRQTGRVAKLYKIEMELQECCFIIPPFEIAEKQPATFNCRKIRSLRQDGSDPAVIFLPSAFAAGDFSAREKLLPVIASHLAAGLREYYFVDSFHHRLRWMERLSHFRQAERREALRREPLRAQAVLDSRSGRQQIAILSPETLSFLELLMQTRNFTEFPLALQEILHTSLELDSIRQRGRCGMPIAFDFIVLCEALAVESYQLRSKRVLNTLTDAALQKFFDATLRRQHFDSDECYRLLSECVVD